MKSFVFYVIWNNFWWLANFFFRR